MLDVINPMKWNILVVGGIKINRDKLSIGERKAIKSTTEIKCNNIEWLAIEGKSPVQL